MMPYRSLPCLENLMSKHMEMARLLIGSVLIILSVDARILNYKWVVKYEFKSPDCYERLVITVNGLSPGPAISARVGDTVYVHVTNDLQAENLAIHWHGITQRGSPWSDGVEGVTQCPILPGETFVYNFKFDKAGTYFYHGHAGMQRSSGLYGLIKVAEAKGVKEPFSYDEELRLIVTDWWHKTHIEQAVGLSSYPLRWVNEPQSLLIEGRGYYNCSQEPNGSKCNNSNIDCAPHEMIFKGGRTFRLRIVNVASLSLLNLMIEGHRMTVVEADGNYVKPVEVEDLNIHSGEAYSVLITANQNQFKNYWVSVRVVGRNSTVPPANAILRYPSSPVTIPPRSAPPNSPHSQWNNLSYHITQSNQIKGLPPYTPLPPPKSERLIILLSTQNFINGYVKWAVNNISFISPNTPLLVSMKYKYKLKSTFDQYMPPDTYAPYDIFNNQSNPNATYGNPVYRLNLNSTVDVVFQNANMLKPNVSDIHPWHLHGHDFWVLAYGHGAFDPLRDTKLFNLVDPPMRNTVPVYPYGWTAIRFKADNPGVWSLHCHLEAHFFMGMGIVLSEGVHKIPWLPSSVMGCGKTRSFFKIP